jgi:amino-acid N-acetyltransferase
MNGDLHMTSPAIDLPTLRLRKAERADLTRIETLLTDNGLPLAGVPDALDTFVVAESGGALVGVGGLQLCCDDALLRSVAVAPQARSSGVGRAIVTRLIADAEARGLRALYLLTETAERYFPTFGFTKITRGDVPPAVKATEEFTSACPESAIVMSRPLAREAATA